MHQSPDDLIEVGTYANEFAAGVVRAKLEEAGIPAQVFTANGPLLGAFGPNGWIPFSVWTRKADADAAVAVLQAVRAEQGSVDWDAQDVGQPEPGDEAARRAADDNDPPRSKHARLGIAGGLLIGSIICGQIVFATSETVPAVAWLIGVIGFVCFLWSTGIAFGVLFMSRTERK